ncbi:hypothetical protein GCM10027447_20000 [Glycomyces halotolerans]
MGLLDKFNELKDMVTGAAEDVKGQAGEMLGGAVAVPFDEQADEVAQQAEEAVQGADEFGQNVEDQTHGAAEDFKNEHGL